MSIKLNKVHPKLIIRERGEFNRRVIDCPHCEYNFKHDVKSLLSNCIGVSSTSFGTMAIIQCPKCFDYWKFHMGKVNYEIFKDVINRDLNIHFPSNIFNKKNK